jgi:hypothetical protein
MDDKTPTKMHAFNHAPAALRIFRFAADTVPRILELAHTTAFLRECATELGSADAALPAAMRNDHSKRFYMFCLVFDQMHSWNWLSIKLLECRNGIVMPVAALAPGVIYHDVNWSEKSARRHTYLNTTFQNGLMSYKGSHEKTCWAQGPVGVTSGKHWFSVTIMHSFPSEVNVGWVDSALQINKNIDNGPGCRHSSASGATFNSWGSFNFGTAPLSENQCEKFPKINLPCNVGCLLDLDAGIMTVFIDTNPVKTKSNYKFPRDRKWFPSIKMIGFAEVRSNSI